MGEVSLTSQIRQCRFNIAKMILSSLKQCMKEPDYCAEPLAAVSSDE